MDTQGPNVGDPNPATVPACESMGFGLYPGQFEITVTSATASRVFRESVAEGDYTQERVVVHPDGSIELPFRGLQAGSDPSLPRGCSTTSPSIGG